MSGENAHLRVWKFTDRPSPEPWTWNVTLPNDDDFWEGDTAHTWDEALREGLDELRRLWVEAP